MAGALMQLVAYGAQDVYLTAEPTISFNVLRIASGMGGLAFSN
jgi:hypothetical protein